MYDRMTLNSYIKWFPYAVQNVILNNKKKIELKRIKSNDFARNFLIFSISFFSDIQSEVE